MLILGSITSIFLGLGLLLKLDDHTSNYFNISHNISKFLCAPE